MYLIGLIMSLPLLPALNKTRRYYAAPGNAAETLRFVFCSLVVLTGALSSCLFSPPLSKAQAPDHRVTSEHMLMHLPAEREALGRDLIDDIERCYQFMDGATGEKLPGKIVLIADWDQAESSCNRQEARITLGMNRRAAAVNPGKYLLHIAAREISRLGLLQLSGGAEREDNAFLFEGMVEILAREYSHSSRSLEAAWIVSQSLDRMGQLGLSNQRSWSAFSEGRRSFRNAAPGITFLTTLREMQGRDKALKFFESLKNNSLTNSLMSVYKAPLPELESAWLKRVREYQAPEEIATAENGVPQLVQTAFSPEECKPGDLLEIRLYIKDEAGDLMPDGVFLRDGRSGQTLQARAASQKNAEYITVAIPVDANCPPGKYEYLVLAVDEAGNVRRWNGIYRVLAP
jgi:hypothetical protein